MEDGGGAGFGGGGVSEWGTSMAVVDGGGLDVRDAPELKEVGEVAELGRRLSVGRGRRRCGDAGVALEPTGVAPRAGERGRPPATHNRSSSGAAGPPATYNRSSSARLRSRILD